MTGKLGVEKAVQERGGLVDADPALVGIAESQREPLPSDRRLPAWLGRMRRDEGCVRQQSAARPGRSRSGRCRRRHSRAEKRPSCRAGPECGASLGPSSSGPFRITAMRLVPFCRLLRQDFGHDRRALAPFDGAIIGPEHARRHGAQRPPRLGKPHHLLCRRPRRQTESQAAPLPAAPSRPPARRRHGRGTTTGKCRRSRDRCRGQRSARRAPRRHRYRPSDASASLLAETARAISLSALIFGRDSPSRASFSAPRLDDAAGIERIECRGQPAPDRAGAGGRQVAATRRSRRDRQSRLDAAAAAVGRLAQ